MTQETLDRANKLVSDIASYRRILITLGDYEEIEVVGKKKKGGVSDSFRIARTDKSKSDSKYAQVMDTFVSACMNRIQENIEANQKELESL